MLRNTKRSLYRSKIRKSRRVGVLRGLIRLISSYCYFFFFLYFLGGYLFYSALFAAVGSAIDSESDTQQFILPITLPLIIAYMMSIAVMQNPDGNIAFWGSMIPFTSPVVMLVRLPMGVPVWQLVMSFSLLIGGFILTTWIAGRIYRTGILMYGKKVSWKEMIKWISYKA